MAPYDIRASSIYTEEITGAIEACDLLLIIFTESSNQSKAVIREVTIADDEEKEIVSLRLEDVKESRALRYLLAGKQHIPAQGMEINEVISLLLTELPGGVLQESLQKDRLEPTPTRLPEKKKPTGPHACFKSLSPACSNSIGMEFMLIQPGEFTMGSNDYDNEKPPHSVSIDNPFYMGKYPVTQEEWIAMGLENRSEYKGSRRPVENVSWHDAQAFIEALNRKEGITGYRLPTEAEWEYACRAGSRTSYYWGDQFSAEYAVAGGKKSTAEVGSKKPNAWGLYDMSGNVWEWMQSQYQPYPYSESDGRNAEDGNAKRVLRGGSFVR